MAKLSIMKFEVTRLTFSQNILGALSISALNTIKKQQLESCVLSPQII